MNSYLSSISHEKKVIISYWYVLKIKKRHLKKTFGAFLIQIEKTTHLHDNTGTPFIRALMLSNDSYHPVS